MYFDIPETVLFKDIQQDFSVIQGRGFVSSDKSATTQYIHAVHHHLSHNNVFNRIKDLMESPRPNGAEAEAIDREITRACMHGESKCKRRCKSYWSVELHQTRRDLSIFCQLRSRRKRKLSCNSLLQRATEIGTTIDADITTAGIATRISELKAKVKSLHQQSAAKREAELLEKANIADDTCDAKKAKILRGLAKSGRRSRMYKDYQYISGKSQHKSGLNRLEVPDSWPNPADYEQGQSLPNPKEHDANLDGMSLNTDCADEGNPDLSVNPVSPLCRVCSLPSDD